MKIMLFFLTIVFPCPFVKSQTVFSSLGGDVNNIHGSLSYTVGQVETHHAIASLINVDTLSVGLHEGVQQSYINNELGISTVYVVAAKLFPNPTFDIITIELLSDSGPYTFELYTLEGKLLLQSKFVEKRKMLNMTYYSSGIYLLRLFDNGQESNYRIVKK